MIIPGDESLPTQSTGIWIVPSMPLHMSLYVVPGDETLATQSTVKWILPSMTLHVCLQVVAEFEFTAIPSTRVSYVLFVDSWIWSWKTVVQMISSINIYCETLADSKRQIPHHTEHSDLTRAAGPVGQGSRAPF